MRQEQIPNIKFRFATVRQQSPTMNTTQFFLKCQQEQRAHFQVVFSCHIVFAKSA